MINSAFTIDKTTWDSDLVPEDAYFHHANHPHCDARADLWEHEFSPCRVDCEQRCPGTTYGSQIGWFDNLDGAGTPYSGEPVLMGPHDDYTETAGTNGWWLYTPQDCTHMCENAFSGGFWV